MQVFGEKKMGEGCFRLVRRPGLAHWDGYLGIGDHILRLNALDDGLHGVVSKERVFAADILEVAAAVRHTCHVHARSELDVGTLVVKLFTWRDVGGNAVSHALRGGTAGVQPSPTEPVRTHGFSPGSEKLEVPSGGHPKRRHKNKRSLAGNALLAVHDNLVVGLSVSTHPGWQGTRHKRNGEPYLRFFNVRVETENGKKSRCGCCVTHHHTQAYVSPEGQAVDVPGFAPSRKPCGPSLRFRAGTPSRGIPGTFPTVATERKGEREDDRFEGVGG